MNLRKLAPLMEFLSSKKKFKLALNFVGVEMNRRYYRRQSPTGTLVMEEDWDNLILLDGCRYDAFKNNEDFDKGRLEQRRSLGSDSWGFIYRNFVNNTLHDSIYITSNPFTRVIPDDTFHYVHNLLIDSWDEEIGTVQPNSVVECTQRLINDFEDKRLIIHFMQPHYPFLGPTGRSFEHAGLVEFDSEQNPLWENEKLSVWGALRRGQSNFNIETVWKAYVENLNLVLEYTEMLINQLDGRTIISSDHGNLFGERTKPIPARGFGHPRDLYVNELVNVPWYIIEGDRRDICSDPPIKRTKLDEQTATDRLAQLGYMEQ